MHRFVTLVLVGLMLIVAGCGNVAERVAEEALERAAEAEGGGDVDIDISGEGGKMEITKEDGSESFVVGEDVALPEGFSLPIPDGGTVVMAIEDSMGDTVTVTYDKDRYDEIAAFYEKFVAGRDEVTRIETPDGLMWQSPEFTIVVARDDKVLVTLSTQS